MTEQEVKARLSQLNARKRLVKAIEGQISEALEDSLPAGVSYDKPSVKGGSGMTAQERYAMAMEKLKKHRDKVQDEVTKLTEWVTEALPRLTADEQVIIVLRYSKGETIGSIRRELHLSERTYFRYHSSAIKKISEA